MYAPNLSLDFFQNLKAIKHKDTKTLRHEEVYRMPYGVAFDRFNPGALA
jgi:hypothetical protein